MPVPAPGKIYGTECIKCKKDDVKLYGCARCGLVKYCSRECQKAHWGYHKTKCQASNWLPEAEQKQKTLEYRILSNSRKKEILLEQQESEIGYSNNPSPDCGKEALLNSGLAPRFMEEIYIEDLKYEEQHPALKLSLTIIGTPIFRTHIKAIQVVGEDAKGGVTRFIAYNIVELDQFKEAAEFTVTEPFFKAGFDGIPMIRVDDPNEIIFKDTHKVNKSAKESKQEGNNLFASKKYINAIYCYEECLKNSGISNQMKGIVHSNMAACYLAIENFRKSNFNAKKALEFLDPNEESIHTKTLIRLATGYLNQEKFEKVKKFSEKVLEGGTKNKEYFEDLIKKSIEYTKIKKEGSFDFSKMLHQNDTIFDYPSYFNPCFVIMETGAKGLGVKASKDIPKGTLILGERAIACKFQKDYNDDYKKYISDNYKLVNKGNLLVEVIKLIGHETEKLKDLYSLNDGTNPKRKLEDIIPQYSEFGLKDLSVGKLIDIIGVNAFGIQPFCAMKGDKHHLTFGDDGSLGSALFLKASLFNHDCNSNVTRFFIGNFTFFWAREDIKEGEELTICYAWNETLNVKERKANLDRSHHFTCLCSTCELQSNTDLSELDKIVELCPESSLNIVHSTQRKIKLGKLKSALDKLDPKHYEMKDYWSWFYFHLSSATEDRNTMLEYYKLIKEVDICHFPVKALCWNGVSLSKKNRQFLMTLVKDWIYDHYGKYSDQFFEYFQYICAF